MNREEAAGFSALQADVMITSLGQINIMTLGKTETIDEYLKDEDRKNRPNEFKIEQGLAAAELPILDQSGSETTLIFPPDVEEENTHVKDEEAIKAFGNQSEIFAGEKEGWRGYIEWEKYPAKKALSIKRLNMEKFPPFPEFQMGPLPDTNPVLLGTAWKMWHESIGGELANEPTLSWDTVLKEKHPEMLHLLKFPYNGESPKRLTTAQAITPNPLHFVRNHGGIPGIDASKWTLELDGLVKNPRTFTLADIQDETRFPRMSKLATMQCSGTRRLEQIQQYPGQGHEVAQAPWAEGAIGNAEWTGVSLKHVIKACGGLIDGGKHLELFGADTYFKDLEAQNYVVSIPWSKVKAHEVILAWSMNGDPLPKIHGYPVRLVVLGYIGARSVKWLYRIRALTKPTYAPVQSAEYLYFTQQVGKHNQRMSDGIQIQEMPVSSAIMSPWNRQVVVHNGAIHCKGWAYSGGGRWVERVELSADGGFSWYAVPLENMSKKKKWAWRTWECDLPVDVEGWIEIVCRCWDNSLNTQPLTVRAAWNWGLHVTSSAHRLSIYSINKSKKTTRDQLDKFEELGIPLAPLTRIGGFPLEDKEKYDKFWDEHDPRDVED